MGRENCPPYMHDGSLTTLDEVIEYYDRGGNTNPALDAELRPLRLTQSEKSALRAFLQSLSGTIVEGNQQSKITNQQRFTNH